MFVANDVVGKSDDRAIPEVESAVKFIVGVSHKHQPAAPVVIVEVTPSESRFAAWGQQRALNARLREVALTTANCYFVSTASHFLSPDGRPRRELFVDDQLHLNEAGYQLWGQLIRRRLDDVFRLEAEVKAPVDR